MGVSQVSPGDRDWDARGQSETSFVPEKYVGKREVAEKRLVGGRGTDRKCVPQVAGARLNRSRGGAKGFGEGLFDAVEGLHEVGRLRNELAELVDDGLIFLIAAVAAG